MKTTKSLSFLVLLIFALGACSKDQAARVKIMSYNIKHGVGNDDSLRLDRSLEVIRAQSPDLVALQEIDYFTERSDSVNQTSYLAESLKMTGSFGQFMPYQGGAYGMATLSAKPIKSTKHLRLPDGIYEPRVAIVQEIEIAEDLTILFANVHFDWVSGDEGEQSRTAQATELIEYINQFDLPVVVTGDFNCEPDSTTMKLFYQSGFEFVIKGEDNLSFQGANKVEIDHVIFRNTEKRHFRVVSIDLLDEPLVSDHRPLVAELELAYQ